MLPPGRPQQAISKDRLGNRKDRPLSQAQQAISKEQLRSRKARRIHQEPENEQQQGSRPIPYAMKAVNKRAEEHRKRVGDQTAKLWNLMENPVLDEPMGPERGLSSEVMALEKRTKKYD